jgi:hypothetical protein
MLTVTTLGYIVNDNIGDPMRTNTAIPLVMLAVAASGCASIAIATAPTKKAAPDDSPAAKAANATFWATLHGGRYDDIGIALDKLETVYLAHPEDPRVAAHIGFLHIWRLAERARRDGVGPTITDDMSLARRYFDEAVRLDPSDPRFRGFLAATTMGEASIHHDEKLTRTGYFAMKDAVDAWPEFNRFTRGYVMSRLPFDDDRYRSAVEDQWVNLDECVGEKVDPQEHRFLTVHAPRNA